MSKVTDRQVRRLRALLKEGKSLKAAALRADKESWGQVYALISRRGLFPAIWVTASLCNCMHTICLDTAPYVESVFRA